MIAALFGIGAALAWGTSDFIARFTSREVGPARSLFGALLTGAVMFSFFAPLSPEPLSPAPDALLYSIIGGSLNMAGLLLLYAALARGPVTVVAPIIGSHPAIAVALLVLIGIIPGPLQWLGMAITMTGLILVTRSIARAERFPELDRDYIWRTVRLAVFATLLFGVQIVVMQEARGTYGAFPTTWLTRVVSLGALAFWALFRRQSLLFPWKEAPLIALQGVLDASGAFFMLAGSVGADRPVIAVISSAFAVITVLLARIVLKEPITPFQWFGILIVFGGIALLSGTG